MGVFLRWLLAIGSVAAGSWVGLHPAAEPVRPASAEVLPVSPSPPPEVAEAAPDPSLAGAHVDTSASPGKVPWPRLNPEASISKAWQLAEGPHRRPDDKRRLVTLTFDDGPFPETTPKVLEVLAKYDVHATFFVIGSYLDGESRRAKRTRSVLRKVVDAGHLVGNHTYDHARLTSISHTQVLEQIDRGSAAIERAIGKKPILFRPPFGELDEFGQAAMRERQLDVLLWSAEASDMLRDDADVMFGELVRQLTYNEGGIVLLHDIRFSSIRILKKLLVYLEARRYDPARPERAGYEVVDLPTYLREVEAAPPQPGARDPLGLKKLAVKSRERLRKAPKPDAS